MPKAAGAPDGCMGDRCFIHSTGAHCHRPSHTVNDLYTLSPTCTHLPLTHAHDGQPLHATEQPSRSDRGSTLRPAHPNR
eukprot:3822987-Rhodomonas_salina.1